MGAATSAQKDKNTVELSLLENGVDFVRAAIVLLYSDEESELLAHKYAVLNVFSGALLILKERLRREHRSLIWVNATDVDDATKPTVDFDTCLDRLEKVAKVTLDGSHRVLLRRAQKQRNKLEHYAVELNLREAETLVAEMVEFIFVFMRDELKENLEDALSHEQWFKVQQLRQIAKRLEEERAKLEQAQIDGAEKVYQDMIIKQLTTEQREWWGRARKYMTMSTADLNELAGDNDDPHTLPMSGAEGAECRECSHETVYPVGRGMAICTNSECRTPFIARLCGRCGGNLILDGDEEDYCEGCYDELSDMANRDE